MSYSFTVKSASAVDFERICNEAPNCKEAVLVVFKHGAAAMLRTAFLERFDAYDGLRLGEDMLYARWGSAYAPTAVDREGAIGIDSTSGKELEGWRALTVPKSAIGEFCAQLQAARAFNPIRKVRVEYL